MKLVLLLFVLGCGPDAQPLPKGPPPEYEEEPVAAPDAGAIVDATLPGTDAP
jgi:hypothetical protein